MAFNLSFEEKQTLNSLESDIENHNNKCLELYKVMRNIIDEKMLRAYLKEYGEHTKKVHILTTRRQMFIDDLIKKYNIE